MKVYMVEYRRTHNPDKWYDGAGQDSTGVYTNLGAARGVATRIRNSRWNSTLIETRILEGNVEWNELEVKQR